MAVKTKVNKKPTKPIKPVVAATPASPAVSSVTVVPSKSRWSNVRPDLLWLIIPALIASHSWWWLLKQLLEPHPVAAPLLLTLWYILGAVVSFSILAGTTLIIPQVDRRRAINLIAAIVVTLPAFWILKLSWAVPLISLSLTIGLWAAGEAIIREVSSRLKIDVRSTLAHVMAWVVLGASLSIALLQYDITQSTLSVNREVNNLTDRTARVLETFAPRFIPNFNPTMTVDELVGTQIPTAESLIKDISVDKKLTTDQRSDIVNKFSQIGLNGNLVPPTGTDMAALKKALDTTLKNTRADLIKEMRGNLSEQLKFTLHGDETVHQAIVNFLTLRIGSKATGFVRFLPPILSIGIFLILRILSPLFEIMAVAAGWGWYRALRLAHAWHIKKVPALAERLEWGMRD